jgi:hypothetical protein
MPKPYDTRLIMMVAQNWFETADNQFCKLVPVVYVDGDQPDESDFPNDGEIWWMLTARTAMLAQPGRLVAGQIEDAIRYDEFDKSASRYQVKIQSVQEVDGKDGMQVVELAGGAIGSVQELVAGSFRLEQPIHPTPLVLVRWRAHVYGPFSVSSDQRPGGSARPGYSLFPADAAGMTVFDIEESTFNSAAKGHRIAVSDEVSVTSQRRSESFQLQPVKHDLVLSSGFERVLATNPKKVVLEPLDRKLLRFARQTLTRKNRQQLQTLLGEMEVSGRDIENAHELLEAVGQVKKVAEKEDAALNSVAEALLKSGFLGEDRLAKAEQTFAQKYVEERTAELQAKIEAAIGERKAALQQVETQLKGLEGTLQNEQKQRVAKLDEEISALKQQSLRSIATERAEFEQKKAELERQEGVLKKNLAQVTQDLRNAGDEVVNRFLTIAPLLGALPTGSAPRHNDTAEVTKPAAVADTIFDVPAFVRSPKPGAQDGALLAENEFLDRFRRVVEESGFVYRPLDLHRFHVSVKCGDITVLGGPSGTGKSSLPALYAHALLGGDDQRPGCLMVNVSPSWMDTRDLLGHLNTLDGRFYPAETGLFVHLVCSQEEFAAIGTSTGIYLACLDEMNLSQVEHYFSDLMMAMERSGEERAIQCFAREAARPASAFLAWARIRLSPAVRFVGTVNFDETTRLLSDRFLDRVNLIRLTSPALPGVAGPSGQFAKSDGRMVTLADFERWRSDKALPPELGGLLDQMRPLLTDLGCAISPRVYRAVCRFVSSSDGVIPTSKAFDVQVAQRVLPKVRNLVTRKQMDAVDGLLRLMEQGSVCAFDESAPLLREARDAAGQRAWNLEEPA